MEATRQAQSLINILAGKHLLDVDGKWGRYTQSRYDALDENAKRVVDELLARYGTSPAKLTTIRRAQKAAARLPVEVPGTLRRFWDPAAIAAMISREGARMRAPSDVLAALASESILQLEAAFNRSGHADASSLHPKTAAAGLFQFLPSTWNRLTAKAGLRPTSRTANLSKEVVEGGPFDAGANVRAFIALAIENAALLRAKGLPVTPSTLYALHQQGAPRGIAALLDRGGWTALRDQSTPSIAVLADAARETGAPNSFRLLRAELSRRGILA